MSNVENITKAKDLVSTVIEEVTQYIWKNNLAPGDTLPGEFSFAQQLKVSRTAVREAFRSLEAMRLINIRTGKSATVAHLDHKAMSLLFEHGVITDQINVQQIYDVRSTVEIRTVLLASLHRTEEEAQKIRYYATQMKKCIDDPEKVMEYDFSFHFAIAIASHNPVFSLMLRSFHNVFCDTWSIGWRSRICQEQKRGMIDNHVNIADAIVAGDPQQASKFMSKHFDESVKILFNAGIY